VTSESTAGHQQSGHRRSRGPMDNTALGKRM
jgi:hypothetical protein